MPNYSGGPGMLREEYEWEQRREEARRRESCGYPGCRRGTIYKTISPAYEEPQEISYEMTDNGCITRYYGGVYVSEELSRSACPQCKGNTYAYWKAVDAEEDLKWEWRRSGSKDSFEGWKYQEAKRKAAEAARQELFAKSQAQVEQLTKPEIPQEEKEAFEKLTNPLKWWWVKMLCKYEMFSEAHKELVSQKFASPKHLWDTRVGPHKDMIRRLEMKIQESKKEIYTCVELLAFQKEVTGFEMCCPECYGFGWRSTLGEKRSKGIMTEKCGVCRGKGKKVVPREKKTTPA